MVNAQLFVGHDPRESVGSTVFQQSVFEHAAVPVSITRLMNVSGESLNDGDTSNAFSLRRFLVPYYMGYNGYAIWCDGADMLCRWDINRILECADHYSAVQVVQHDYRTQHPRKYIGTPMESDNLDYPCKNWSSVMLWNCGHFANRVLTPQYVSETPGKFLHRFGWIKDRLRIGSLPAEWNVLVGETEDGVDAKIAHFTLGIPAFEYYRRVSYADEWFKVLERAVCGVQESDDQESQNGIAGAVD